MDRVKITIRPNGPYRVEDPGGVIDLLDAAGNKYDLSAKPAYSLCRCGASVNKPFCDGTHSKIGFQAAEAAVRAETAQSPGQSPATAPSASASTVAPPSGPNDPRKT
jgi:CDGSH-type Zn-finger protein